eukprot:m.94625 g.94625  ORF g.94625 m.94625 type:complete len:1074 (-) comp8927_c0_seq1:2588-5809(-)
MGDVSFVRQVETYCQELYEGNNAQRRQQAQQFVFDLENLPDVANKCKLVLENSTVGYAQFIATTTLTSVVSKAMTPLDLNQRLELKQYALDYLLGMQRLEPFVVAELCKLIGRLTKLCWFEETQPSQFPFRSVLDDAMRFLEDGQGNKEIYMRGLQLLNFQVTEMNQPDNIEGLAKHRKVCSSFRDENLFEIFQLSLNEMGQIIDRQETDNESMMMMGWVLQLCRSCMGYDFIGSCTDETTDDLKTVQIPGSWKDAIIAPNLIPTFFQLYLNLEGTLASHVLNCLVYLASVRRTLFSVEQRMVYLGQLVSGVCSILETKHELKNGDNYHEFSRLLARLKTNYQLAELVSLDDYDRCINLIAEFTLVSLENWEFAANSVHFILGLWERLVSSIPYMKTESNHHLQDFTPQLFEAYVKSRLQTVELVVQNGVDDPLEDETTLSSQLKQIATIARCDFSLSCDYLIQTLEGLSNNYLQLIQSGTSSDDMFIQEGQVTWVLQVIAAVIGARATAVVSDEDDVLDSQLISQVVLLIQLMEQYRPGFEVVSEKVNMALIKFLDQLRMNYLGEQRHKCKKLEEVLKDNLNIENELALLDIVINKIMSNLQWCIQSDTVIRSTLSLFSDFCTPFGVAKKLINLDSVQFMLGNHNSETFAFLNSMDDTKHRTAFYQALGKLINHEFTAEDERFEMFMTPLAQTADALEARFNEGGDAVRRDDDARRAFLGFSRDIRGLLSSCITKTSYMLVFDWLYPDKTPLFIRGIELWHDDPIVAIPCIKCMCEFAYCRNSRLSFGPSSPNGILLFKETSLLLTTYGNALLQHALPSPDQIYPQKYKGILACFNALKMTLSGDYVNFGVFKLYGDPCLENVMTMFFQMMDSIPIDDMNDYPKLSKAYYSLMLYITRDHSSHFASISAESFRFMLLTLQQGVRSVMSTISINSCTALDSLLSFVHTNCTKPKHPVEADTVMSLLQDNQEILMGMLSDMFHILMHEACKNQWSMSRPMLPLILFHPEHFEMIKNDALDNATSNRKQAVETAFNNLMEDVEESLLVKNRDKFTQKICIFRRTLTTNDSEEKGN